MLEHKRVGVLLADEKEIYPLQEAQVILAQHGIVAVCLNQTADTPEDLDLVMAMGGDGTVLQALDRFPEYPVLAINFGRVGFLTAGDRTDLEQIIALLVAGRFIVSERLVLDCQYPGGRVRATNEVMVRVSNRLIFTDVFVNDAKIRTIRGDGVVVGTPTGSTAFLLSTGAPIVMPDVRCIILDGINEHNFTSRPLILPPDSRICLHLSPETRAPHAYLLVDGRQLSTLEPEQEVHISQAARRARLIYFDESYFFHNLSSKLSW